LQSSMEEVTYYADDDVSVTSEQVKLGDKIYPLADVKWVRLVWQPRGWRIGSIRIPTLLVTILIAFAAYSVAALLFQEVLPTDSDSIVPYVLAAAVGLITQVVITYRLQATGHYRYVLGISGTSGTDRSFSSPDVQYLTKIESTIKTALRDYDARQEQQMASTKY
jgi:hypothetical protein